jgi:hypothetical protein
MASSTNQHLGDVECKIDEVPEIILKGQDLLERMRAFTKTLDERVQHALRQPDAATAPLKTPI